MDFKSMKRKELQALCKKHKIPANLSNLEMTKKLTEFFKEKENPLIQGPVKGQDENATETESTDVVVNKKVKKVRFSPEHELIEFTRFRETKRSRRNSVSNRNSSCYVENVDNGKMNNESVVNTGRVTRYRGLKGKVNEKGGRASLKCYDQKDDVSAGENFDSDQLRESDVNSPNRVINVDSGKMNNESVVNPGRVTRYRGLKGKVNEKGGQESLKSYDQKDDVSAGENFGSDQLRESDVNSPNRVMRLRGKILVVGVKNASKRGTRRAKDDDERDKKAVDNVDDKELNEEIVGSPRRLTRSKRQKLTEASLRMENRGEKVVKNIDEIALVSVEKNRLVSRNSFRKKGVVGEGKLARGSGQSMKSNGKGPEEVLESDKTAGVHAMIEPQNLLRRSKRNASRVGDSATLSDDSRQHKNGGIKGLKKPPKLFTMDGSGVDAEITGSDIDMDARVVVQVEEPVKLERRRSNRRKTMISSHGNQGNGELEAENKSRYTLGSSVPELVIADGVSKDDKKVPQPTGVTRRSRRLTLVSGDEKIGTDAAVENFGAECLVEKRGSVDQKNTKRSRRHASKYKSLEVVDEFSRDSLNQQNNEARKRKRCPISRDDMKTNDDPSSPTQSMKGSRTEKDVPAAALGEVAGETSSKSKEPNMLDAPSHQGLLEIGESLLVDAQVSNVSEGDESNSSPGLINGKSTSKFIIDVGLTSSRKTNRKKKDESPTDTAGRADMKLINENELENLDDNGALRIAELKIDSEKQISMCNIRDVKKVQSLVEFDVQELIEQDIAEMDKIDTEAQVFNHGEDSSNNTLIDNQIILEGSNVSGNEGFAETNSSADRLLHGDQTEIKTGLEVTDTEAGECAQPSSNVVYHFGEAEGISVQENLESVERIHSSLGLDVQEQQGITNIDKNDPEAQVFRQAEDSRSNTLIDDQIDQEGSHLSRNEGFPETSSSAVSLLLGDQTDFKIGLEVTEAEAEKSVQPTSDVVDLFGELQGISVQENLESVETVHSLLEFDVKESIKKDIKKMDKNDPEAQVFSQVKDSSSNSLIDKKIILEDSNIAGNEGFPENSSPADCILLDDPTDIKTGLEVTEAETDKHLEPNSGVVDHYGEVEGIFVQQNLESIETGKDNVMSSPIACHHNDMDRLEASNTFSDNDNKVTSLKSGVVGAFESSERCIDSTVSNSALQLKEPSPVKLTRLDGENTAEEDETSLCNGIESKTAETDEGDCLKDHRIGSSEDSEFSVPDGERSARIIPQDGRIFSGEYSVMASDEQGIYNDSLAVDPITICANSAKINPKRSLEADYLAKGDKIHVDNSIHSDVAETDQGGSSKGQRSKCDGNLSASNPFHAERRARNVPSIRAKDREIFSGENSIRELDEQAMFHDSPSVAPTTISNCVKIKLGRDEADKIAEGHEACAYQDVQSELAETDEGGWLKNHKSTKDEDWEFGISDLFDGERSARITAEDRGIFSTEFSTKDFNERVIFHDFPAVSSMCASCNDIKFTGGSSNLLEINPSNPIGVSESKEKQESPMAKTTAITIMNKTFTDVEHEIFDQADEPMREYTYEQAEKPNSPSAEPTAAAIVNTMEGQEAFNSTSETSAGAMYMSKTNGKQEASLIVEGSNTDEDDNDVNHGKDKEDCADACIADVEVSMDYPISKIGVESLGELKFQDTEETENQCKDLLAGHMEPDFDEDRTDAESSQSWTEIELSNLLGATVDDVTSSGLNDTSSQEAGMANLITPMNKSIAKSGGGFTQNKKETEGERRGSECDIEDGNSAHENVQDAGHEFKNYSFLGNLSSDNSEDVTNEELNEVQSLELVNISTKVLSEAEYDGCGPLEGQLTDNTECLEETTIAEEKKEEKIVPLEQSCVYDETTNNGSEAMEKTIINSSGSPRNLDKFDGCPDKLINTDLPENINCGSIVFLKSEREMAQSSEASFELSDVDFQKFNVPENSQHPTSCYKDEDGVILMGTSIDTYSVPLNEVANSCRYHGNTDVIDKGNSHCPFPKAPYDDDEVTESKDAESIREDDDPSGAKDCDKALGNTRSSHDRTDELHTNCEVATLKSLSVGDTLCQEADKFPSTLQRQSSCKETGTTIQNVDNMVPAADNVSSVCQAESAILSSLAMHLVLGYNENGDVEKSEEGTPVLNLEGDHEKNDKEVKENSTARIVQFSVSELHLEEKLVDYNKYIHAVSEVAASGCNETLKETDVADTIKEYMDSECSLPVDLDDSCGASLPPVCVLAHIDERTTCENAVLCESEDDTNGSVSKSKGEDEKSSFESLEIESKEMEEAALLMEHVPGSGKEVKSPACVDLLVEGSTVNNRLSDESEDGHSVSSSIQLCLTAKKNARTILIHGTPGKLLAMADMKENAPKQKSSNVVGDITTLRPAKRRALQDIDWK